MENRKVALITGITGQDGSYLAEILVMMCTAQYAARRLIIVSVLLILKAANTSTCIMPTSATQ